MSSKVQKLIYDLEQGKNKTKQKRWKRTQEINKGRKEKRKEEMNNYVLENKPVIIYFKINLYLFVIVNQLFALIALWRIR